MAKQTIKDVVSGSLTYEGESELGNASDSPNWTIKQITVSGNITSTKYPCREFDGKPTDEPIFNWEQRTLLNYSFNSVKELVRPELESAIRDSSTQITVTLSELALDTSITKSNNGGFTVFETGTPATTYAVSAIAPGATDDLVVLTVANTDASSLSGLTITYTNGTNGTIVDLNGNLMLSDTTGVTIDAWDALPEMVSAERIANTTIRVTLSEDCLDATITKANDGGFVVYETGTPTTTYAVSAIAKNGSNADQIDLTVADIVASASVGVTVTYVQGGNGNVADLNSNLMATDATGVLVTAWA